MKKTYKILYQAILLTLIISQFVFASTINQYPELTRVLNFISFLIGLIRFGASSVAGLIMTTTGWHIMTNTNGSGMENAKKTFKNALVGIIIIFSGSTIAKFMVDKAALILLG